MVEDINWIIEFERLARPRLQKIFEEDLVGIPAALAERLEALRKRRRPTERMLRPSRPRIVNASREAELLVSKKPHLNLLTNCAVGCS